MRRLYLPASGDVYLMTFKSVLFDSLENDLTKETITEPGFFHDLNLGQIIDAITAGREEYHLKPLFYTSLNAIDAIKYRHEIFQDLEDKPLFESIKAFSLKIGAMRRNLALIDKLYYKYHKEGWFLEAVNIYCEAVNCLADDLSSADLKSRGLQAFRKYLIQYTRTDLYMSLLAETEKLKSALSTVKYCIRIKDNSLKVQKYNAEIDYNPEVEETFDKFKQGAVEDYRVNFSAGSGMNHITAQILDFVAKLYPDIFLDLDAYYKTHANFLNETIDVFDREVQFYISYLSHTAKFKRAGLPFCYPHISDQSKEVYNDEGFDLALANKCINENSPIVCNDFYLKGAERIFVVSGPNQGGKTTFARTFGQLHYLAGLGCPVPGKNSQLFLFDRLFTHFEKQEKIENLRGKLQDDLIRIHAILNKATSNSIIILNEIFTSTALKDAVYLGKKVMEKIINLDLLGVCVTFVDEWASLSEKTVSMVSTIVPDNPALRTYKIVRKPADGLAYALSIAAKYRVTYHCLRERIPS